MIGHITIINIALGTGWAVASVVMTALILSGRYLYEPNFNVALAELLVAVACACWFLWQIPYWWIKLRRRKNNAT